MPAARDAQRARNAIEGDSSGGRGFPASKWIPVQAQGYDFDALWQSGKRCIDIPLHQGHFAHAAHDSVE